MKKHKKSSFLSSYEWKDIRSKALSRDNHKCYLCECKDNLVVHHILYRRYYKDYVLDLDNLITVCRKCHYKIHRQNDTMYLIAKMMIDRHTQI